MNTFFFSFGRGLKKYAVRVRWYITLFLQVLFDYSPTIAQLVDNGDLIHKVLAWIMGQLINLSVSDDTTRPFGGVNQKPHQEQHPCPCSCQNVKSNRSIKFGAGVTFRNIFVRPKRMDDFRNTCVSLCLTLGASILFYLDFWLFITEFCKVPSFSPVRSISLMVRI